jgi:hypothetical protein
MVKDHKEKVNRDKENILMKEAERKIDITYSLGIICLSVDGLPIFRVTEKPSSADELTPSQAEAKMKELRRNYVALHMN